MYVNIVLFSPPESCEMLVINNKNMKIKKLRAEQPTQLLNYDTICSRSSPRRQSVPSLVNRCPGLAARH